MFDITLADGVLYSFIVVAVAIVIDTLLGAIKAAKDDYDSFDFRKLPKFLAAGILPYVGGLSILALAAEFVGDVFIGLFIPLLQRLRPSMSRRLRISWLGYLEWS